MAWILPWGGTGSERDFFDFRGLFKAFRVTLGKNVNNNFWLVWKICQDFLFFPRTPGLLTFLDHFWALGLLFGIKTFWLSLMRALSNYGCSYGCGCGLAVAGLRLGCGWAVAGLRLGWGNFCRISNFTPGLKETFVLLLMWFRIGQSVAQPTSIQSTRMKKSPWNCLKTFFGYILDCWFQIPFRIGTLVTQPLQRDYKSTTSPTRIQKS